MKAKDLAEELIKFPDFEVEAYIMVKDGSKWGIELQTYRVESVGDIGYSDKVIVLDLGEKE